MDRQSGSFAGRALLFGGMATLAGAIALVVTANSHLVGGLVVAGLVFTAMMVVSGNARTLCIWGLVFFTPLEFSKFWMIHKHVGGEFALRLEASDLFLVPLLLFWLGDLITTRDWRIRIPKAAIWWVLLILLAVGTVAFGRWRLMAAFEVVRMGKALLLFLALCNLLQRPAQLRGVVMVLACGLLMQSAYGLFQYATGRTLGLDRIGEAALRTQDIGSGLEVETHRRVGALMGHPNILSGYLAMLLPLVAAMLFSRSPLRLKGLCLGGLALGLPTLLATLSRNGWGAFAIALLLVIWLTRRHEMMRRRYGPIRMAVLAVLVLGVLVSSRLIVDRITLTGTTSTDARWALNGIAWDMVTDEPIFGHGKNSMAYEMATMPQYQLKAPYNLEGMAGNPVASPPIHNIYLQQWAEQGTVGMVLFALMMISIIAVGIRNLRVNDDVLFAMNAGFLAGVVAILIHGFFDWIFWVNGMMRLFWVFAACILSIHYVNARTSEGAALARAAEAG